MLLTSPPFPPQLYFENWVTKEVTWERPAALGWSRRSQNKTFWWNIVSGETQRATPESLGFQTPEGHTYFVDPKTGESTWDKPAVYTPAATTPCASLRPRAVAKLMYMHMLKRLRSYSLP